MNKVILMGRLTRDPEVRYTSGNNTLVASFSIAVNRRFARQGEERQADFFNVVAWDKTGEFCSKYFKKGQQVGVIGRLQTRNYDDKDGKKVYVTEVIVCYSTTTTLSLFFKITFCSLAKSDRTCLWGILVLHKMI